MDHHQHLDLEREVYAIWLLVDVGVILTLQQLVVVLAVFKFIKVLHDLDLLAGALPLLHRGCYVRL